MPIITWEHQAYIRIKDGKDVVFDKSGEDVLNVSVDLDVSSTGEWDVTEIRIGSDALTSGPLYETAMEAALDGEWRSGIECFVMAEQLYPPEDTRLTDEWKDA